MNHAASLPDQRGDIQAVLASGFGWLECSRFWLMTIKNAPDSVPLARAWIQALHATNLVQSIEQVRVQIAKKPKPPQLAAIAFSHAGLRTLGLVESAEFPFPTAFRSGMGSELREKLLRDDSREEWGWSDAEAAVGKRRVVHILLALWWTKGELPPVLPNEALAFDKIEVQGCPSFFNNGNLYEPFKFRDGVSQPVIYGLKDNIDASPFVPTSKTKNGPDADPNPDQVIAAGEFILGYRNEYDELSYCPNVVGWRPPPHAPAGAHFGLNGSYLAVRQIEQDIEKFAEAEALSAPGCPAGVALVEAMMGRRRDGTPLELPAQNTPLPDLEANGFRYRLKDQNGFTTPRGSHIRRANPRDMLAHDVESGIASSKLHRLLRRGRPYRDIVEREPTAGLFFIACNTDLERQFEFVHQRWLRNPRFADLEDEDDPFVGTISHNKKFSMQGLPSGTSVAPFKSFTATIGGGYFFLPGLKALEFLVSFVPAGARGRIDS